MSDTFLPGNGFDTYEEQDRVLVGIDGGRRASAAVRILQQQGFAVAGAVVRLTDDESEQQTVEAAKQAASALGIECIALNAAAIAATGPDARFVALCTAADRLGIRYIATGHLARIETDSDGVSRLLPGADGTAPSAALAALSQDILDRLILPLGVFAAEDIDALADGRLE